MGKKANELYVEIAAGQALFREGDAGTDMFIIESGSIEIRRALRGSAPVAVLEAGDFFGEMAILEDQPRFASAVARTPCRLLRIERGAFADLLRENVEIAVRIMRKLVARQRRSEQRATELENELAQRSGAAAAVDPAPEAPRAPRRATPAPPPRKPTPLPPARVVAAATISEPAAVVHPASGQRFVLQPGCSEYLVGRADPVTGITPEINLGPLDSARSLSRRHAKLLAEGGLYFLREEVGTANGTFVNGVRLPTGVAVPVKTGDRLKFGAVEVELVAA